MLYSRVGSQAAAIHASKADCLCKGLRTRAREEYLAAFAGLNQSRVCGCLWQD